MPKAEHDSPQREVSYKVKYSQLKKHYERLQQVCTVENIPTVRINSEAFYHQQRAQLMAAISEQEQEIKRLRKEKG